jgi:hypothetical protein
VRRKAAYLAFENDPELEFEFFLAEQLKMTVARLRREMSNDELLRWSVFYARRRQNEELAAKMAQAPRRGRR